MLPGCSYRRVTVFFFACLTLTSASQVLSPAAPRDETPVTATPAVEQTPTERSQPYAWLSRRQRREYIPMAERLGTPAGFGRVPAPKGSFAHWLRHLPVAPENTPVTTADSKIVLAGDHPNLAAVVALQPHHRKLLCSANMMVRLRAEYCWSARRPEALSFHFTSGQLAGWRAWASGERPVANGRSIRFAKTSITDESRESFCGYLETLFGFTSSMSLLDDTRSVQDGTIAAGDILLRPGRGGHALMVLDVATNARRQVLLLLGEGGSPAQTFHVLCNDHGSPWFPITQSRSVDFGRRGVFGLKQLRRWVR